MATVDAMSGGRAELGIGAAWYEREHRFFGIPFPPLGERFDRLGEQLEVITGLWRTAPGEKFSYHGQALPARGVRQHPPPRADPADHHRRRRAAAHARAGGAVRR